MKLNLKLPKGKVPERKKLRIGKRRLLILALLLIFAAGGSFAAKTLLFDKAPETKLAGHTEENADTEDLEGRLASDIIKIMKSGNYLIRYRTTTVYEGKPYDLETTYAVSGNMIALASADRATIIRDGKVYMLNHTDHSMISWDVTGTDNPRRIETEGLTFLESREAGGLVCEEYAAPATHISFYFNGDQLMKMAARINGRDMVMEILEVAGEAPESLFAVPAGYRNTSL